MIGRWTGLLLCLLLAMGTAHANERILSFTSDITVHTDGSMTVAETIRVRAEGNQIRRGIYRDFPMEYRDHMGNRFRVTFDLLDTSRDGKGESFHTESRGNGIRIYLGAAEALLKPGEYTYFLRYRTSRQLGFLPQHDELYWNVTGNDWAFPIDDASATVRLPDGVPPDGVTAEAYTGVQGAQGEDYRARVGLYGEGLFNTTRGLAPGEGLTIVVTWPKGFVAEPSAADEAVMLVTDNGGLAVGVVGLTLLIVYYLMAWRRVGRDPEGGVIIPRYEPPPGYSPAASRFIWRRGYDDKTFATAVVSLAVKGALALSEAHGTYRLELREGTPRELAPGERVLLKHLFKRGKHVTLETSQHRLIREAKSKHRAALRLDYEKSYFVTNRKWLLPGILGTLAILMVAASAQPGANVPAAAFLIVWLSGWTFGVVLLARAAATAWRQARSGSASKIISAIGASLFLPPFLLGEAFGLFALTANVSVGVAAILVLAVLVNFGFYHWLQAPTAAGRRLLDKLEGFRLFLDVAEKDEMNLRNPPDKTPQLFERYLPFAMALDVEQHWAEKFTGVLAVAQQGAAGGYQPVWYSGRVSSGTDFAALAGGLGSSLSGAVSAASTAPGSSSGSGGGGSSGGGGGGGGGGGW